MKLVVGAVAAVLVFISPSLAAPLCPQPRPKLSLGQPSTNVEIVNLINRSQRYTIDLYSAFAPQSNSIHANYCLRYEVENTSTVPIAKFYWPLASIEMDSLPSKQRQSVVFTQFSDKQPWVAETNVFAFLSEEAKSRAYQVDEQKSKQASADRQIATAELTPAITASSRKLRFVESGEFPQIGAEFSDSSSEVTATSSAKWDGERISISILITRNDEMAVKSVTAPLALALAKGFFRLDVVAQAAFRNFSLPFEGNNFSAHYTYEKTPELFVVVQPITLVRESGRVCFLAASYSPVPLPKTATCDLFH